METRRIALCRPGPAECAERLNPPSPAKSREQGVLDDTHKSPTPSQSPFPISSSNLLFQQLLAYGSLKVFLIENLLEIDACRPGGATPLPPLAARIPPDRPILTGASTRFGSKIAVQLCGRGPWDLLGPNYQNYTLPGALLGPKPQIFTLPGTPPRSLKAKSKIIKKQLFFPS